MCGKASKKSCWTEQNSNELRCIADPSATHRRSRNTVVWILKIPLDIVNGFFSYQTLPSFFFDLAKCASAWFIRSGKFQLCCFNFLLELLSVDPYFLPQPQLVKLLSEGAFLPYAFSVFSRKFLNKILKSEKNHWK